MSTKQHNPESAYDAEKATVTSIKREKASFILLGEGSISVMKQEIEGRECYLAVHLTENDYIDKTLISVGASVCDPDDAFYPEYGQQIAVGRALMKDEPDMAISVTGNESYERSKVVSDALNTVVESKVEKIKFCLKQLDEEERSINKQRENTVIKTRQALRNHIS